MDLGLKGKVTVVSAASACIGKAVAMEMAKEGCDVSICARGKEDLEKAAEEVRKHGVRVVAVQADVTKANDVQRVASGYYLHAPPAVVFVDGAQRFNCFRHGELLADKTCHESASPNLAPGFP